MCDRAKKVMVFFLVVSLMLVPAASVIAQPGVAHDEADAGAMAADLLVIRPVSLVALVAGGAVFLVSLPFSAAGGNVEAAKEKLVAEPAYFLFGRPLGEF